MSDDDFLDVNNDPIEAYSEYQLNEDEKELDSPSDDPELNNKKLLRTRILKRIRVDVKWWRLRLSNLDNPDGKQYDILIKPYFLSDVLEAENISMELWYLDCFYQVIDKCIDLKVEILWKMDKYGDFEINSIGENADKLREWVNNQTEKDYPEEEEKEKEEEEEEEERCYNYGECINGTITNETQYKAFRRCS